MRTARGAPADYLTDQPDKENFAPERRFMQYLVGSAVQLGPSAHSPTAPVEGRNHSPDPLTFVVFDIEGAGLPTEVELAVPRRVYESDRETDLDQFIQTEIERLHGARPSSYAFDCEEC